jgi:putative sterol carrier protein
MIRNTNPISDKGEGFAVLPDLTVPHRGEIQETLNRLGELLASSQLRVTLQLRLVHDAAAQRVSCFNLVLDGRKATTSAEPANKPDVELIMVPETWWEIASGRVAPHEAFLRGRMRVRGDTDLAQRMLKYVAGSSGRTHLCTGEE